MAHCYRPPSDDVGVFDRLAEDIDHLGSTFPGAVFALLGDLNTHLRAWLPGTCHDNEAGKACHLLAVTHGLDQIVDEPTRYYTFEGESKSSCVDLFLTDTPDAFKFVQCSASVGSADHAVVEIQFIGEFASPAPAAPREVKLYSKADWDGMNEFF